MGCCILRLGKLTVCVLLASALLGCAKDTEKTNGSTNSKEAKQTTHVTTTKEKTKKVIDYLFPKTTFTKFNSVIYDDGYGKATVIGQTSLDNNSLLAIKYEGDFVNEWKVLDKSHDLMDLKAIYDDGTSNETTVGSVESIYAHYKDKNGNVFFIYKIGDAKPGAKLVRVDYNFTLQHGDPFKTAELSTNKETTTLLGIEKLAPYSSSSPITLEDSSKKVEIKSYSYSEGMLNVKGKVQFKEDVTGYKDTPIAYFPALNAEVDGDQNEGAQSDYFKGISKNFNISFKLNNPLSIQDTYVEAYLFGLGANLKLTGDAKVPQSKSILSHPIVSDFGMYNNNLFPSQIVGLNDWSGKPNHNALRITMEDSYINNVNSLERLSQNRVTAKNFMKLGSLYQKLTFDLKLEKPYEKDATPIAQDLNTHIYFYSLPNPQALWNKYDNSLNPSEQDKAELQNVKLLKDVVIPHGQEVPNVELDVSNVDYLGIYVDGPAYSAQYAINKSAPYVLLANGEMIYKN